MGSRLDYTLHTRAWFQAQFTKNGTNHGAGIEPDGRDGKWHRRFRTDMEVDEGGCHNHPFSRDIECLQTFSSAALLAAICLARKGDAITSRATHASQENLAMISAAFTRDLFYKSGFHFFLSTEPQWYWHLLGPGHQLQP